MWLQHHSFQVGRFELWFSIFSCYPNLGVGFALWLQFSDGFRKSFIFSLFRSFLSWMVGVLIFKPFPCQSWNQKSSVSLFSMIKITVQNLKYLKSNSPIKFFLYILSVYIYPCERLVFTDVNCGILYNFYSHNQKWKEILFFFFWKF